MWSSSESEIDDTDIGMNISKINNLPEIFMASQTMKHAMENHQYSKIKEKCILTQIPPLLFSMFAWICGLSSKSKNENIHVDAKKQTCLISIAQDIMFLNNPTKKSTKNIMLSLTTKQDPQNF